jgi:excisionase family DNA binding protein
MEKLLLTPVEAAQVLGIGRSKLYQLLRDGQISSVRIGKCRRIPATALRDLVDRLCPDRDYVAANASAVPTEVASMAPHQHRSGWAVQPGANAGERIA